MILGGRPVPATTTATAPTNRRASSRRPGSGISGPFVGVVRPARRRPVPRDSHGDGVTDLPVYRPSTRAWIVARTLDDAVRRGRRARRARGPDPRASPGGLDGDTATDVGVYRPSTSSWYVRDRLAVQFGMAGDRPVPATTTATGSSTSPRIVRRSAGGASGISSRSISAGRTTSPCPATTRRRPHRPCVLPSVDRPVDVAASSSCPSGRRRRSLAGSPRRRRRHRHGGLTSLTGVWVVGRSWRVQFGVSADPRFRPTTTRTASSTWRSTGPRPACGCAVPVCDPVWRARRRAGCRRVRRRPPYGAGGVPAVDGSVVRAKSVRRAVRGRRGYAGRAHRRKPVIPYRGAQRRGLPRSAKLAAAYRQLRRAKRAALTAQSEVSARPLPRRAAPRPTAVSEAGRGPYRRA